MFPSGKDIVVYGTNDCGKRMREIYATRRIALLHIVSILSTLEQHALAMMMLTLHILKLNFFRHCKLSTMFFCLSSFYVFGLYESILML